MIARSHRSGMRWIVPAAVVMAATLTNARPEEALSVGAAALEMAAEDAMTIGGSIHGRTSAGQEGKLRAVAIVVAGPDETRVALAACDDWIGYIPDAPAYDLGGYQVWMGLHSWVARGSGERIVEESVEMLEELHAGTTSPTAVDERQPKVKQLDG